MKQEIFQNYLEALVANLKTGDAGERTHYPALKTFLEQSGKDLDHESGAFIEPKNQILGIPDFYVLDSRGRLIGHVEVKDVGEDLNKIEITKQLKGYLEKDGYQNLILTNYTEWRLYKNGKQVNRAHLADPKQLAVGLAVSFGNDDLHNLLRDFFSVRTAHIRSPKVLAQRLAEKARVLRDNVIKFELDTEKNSELLSIYQTFREYLLPDMDTKQFADIYAQTLTYGLFVARLHAPEDDFDRRTAEEYVPKNIPLLRSVFSYLSGAQTPESVKRLVDEIVDLLVATKVPDLVGNLRHTKKADDPIVYFYEDFMTAYDPEEKELRGQYYTPAQIVSYMVRSVHNLLKDKFDKPMGLADSSVHILDPATGTATFPAEIIQVALQETMAHGQGGSRQQVINQVLNHLSAFELMMGSYVVGHLKIDVLITEIGLQMQDSFRLYLTNTLENIELQTSLAPIAKELSEETHQALEVKNKENILIIVGNPPYSGHSSNKGEWITRLMRGKDISTGLTTANYFEVDGKPLGEKQPKWINDDYVKFIRFAQWKIEQVGEGMLLYITNHAWLDNPTFRGMRQSLLNSFDEIFVYDLHGNAKKKEISPDGSKDENVFDIQQGVAISIFIKNGSAKKIIRHADLFGLRDYKYKTLLDTDYQSTHWQEIEPVSPQYLFVPATSNSEYLNYPSIKDIFEFSNVGVLTARDDLVIDIDKNNLQQRIIQFAQGVQTAESLNLHETAKFKLDKTIAYLQNNFEDKKIVRYAYRPFDDRWIYYDNQLVERPAQKLMKHLLGGDNIAICVGRQGQVVGDKEWNVVAVTDKPVDLNYYRRGGEVVFPLRLTGPTKLGLFESNISDNFSKDYIKNFSQSVSGADAENIFTYIYSVLYTPAYRQLYDEYLRRDFPRIPWPKSQKEFEALSRLGHELIELHLMKKKGVRSLGTFNGDGDNFVKKVRPEVDKIWINPGQFFAGIPKNVWDYRVGGYQVMDKWLKSRKNRHLSLDETLEFCRIAGVLEETIKIQAHLDKVWRG